MVIDELARVQPLKPRWLNGLLIFGAAQTRKLLK